jgi:hypothetical protein
VWGKSAVIVGQINASKIFTELMVSVEFFDVDFSVIVTLAVKYRAGED